MRETSNSTLTSPAVPRIAVPRTIVKCKLNLRVNGLALYIVVPGGLSRAKLMLRLIHKFVSVGAWGTGSGDGWGCQSGI